MAALEHMASTRLALLQERNQLRTLRITHREMGGNLEQQGQTLLSFSCNDIFGLSQQRAIIAAAQMATNEYGVGAGASRLITGNIPLYEKLEVKLAQMKQTQAACVFGSGYLANLGIVPLLVGSGDLILMDRLSHACMLDGARLSGADTLRFAHNNIEHCRMLLEANRSDYQHCLIMTETVFSMDGDRAPLEELAELCREYNCWLMSDDAHGLGIVPADEVTPYADIQMGTLSKAAGGYGGYVCASEELIDLCKTAARTLMFSTALPPAILAVAYAALEIIETDKNLCAKPLENARYFAECIGLGYVPQSHIVPVIVQEEERALAASEMLREAGYHVAAIRPPTVPPGTSRLRFAFSTHHTHEQINAVAALLKSRGYA